MKLEELSRGKWKLTPEQVTEIREKIDAVAPRGNEQEHFFTPKIIAPMVETVSDDVNATANWQRKYGKIWAYINHNYPKQGTKGIYINA